MAEAGIRVLVVDDHEMVRLGLITYLQTEPGIDVVGEAAGGQKRYDWHRNWHPM